MEVSQKDWPLLDSPKGVFSVRGKILLLMGGQWVKRINENI